MRLVERRPQLTEACDALRDAPDLFLDTEFASSHKETKLCLVQLRAADGPTWVVDALAVGDLAPLGALLGGGARWVLHAGQQDVPLLCRTLAMERPGVLFDTQIAHALTSAEASVSLAYLQFVELGRRAGKGHQASDWTRRPLPRAQLEYAASDVEHLPALADKLSARAAALGRLDAVAAASQEACWPDRGAPRRLTLESFRNAWQLDARQQAALVALLEWLAALPASERAEAPDPKVLFNVASRVPENAEELCRIQGVPRGFGRRQGTRLAELMWRAAEAADRGAFEPLGPPPYATFERIRLDGWLAWARAELAARLRAAPELLLPARQLDALRDALEDGAPAEGALDALTSWRAALLADAWAELVRQAPPPGR